VFGESALEHTALADEEDAVLDDAHANRMKLLLLGSKSVKPAAGRKGGEGKKTKLRKLDLLGVIPDNSHMAGASHGRLVIISQQICCGKASRHGSECLVLIS